MCGIDEFGVQPGDPAGKPDPPGIPYRVATGDTFSFDRYMNTGMSPYINILR
jgi:hypothetical protein